MRLRGRAAVDGSDYLPDRVEWLVISSGNGIH